MLIDAQTVIDTSFACGALTVAARPHAPEGKVLCMTVDGVLQDIKPGEYRGDIHVFALEAMTEDIAKEKAAMEEKAANEPVVVDVVRRDKKKRPHKKA